MTPDDAQKLVNALDLEIARRRKRKDEAEEKAWRESDGPDPVVLFARIVDRLANRLDTPSPAPEPLISDDEQTIRSRHVEELAESASEVAERLERLCDQEDLESDPTIPKRTPVYIGPKRARLAYDANGMPAEKAKGGDGKSRKLSRTELHLQKQEAELQARQALVVHSQQESAQRPAEGVWRLGSVQRFDSRTMRGIVSFGSVEASFSAGAFRKSGLVTLHPTQRVECLTVTASNGTVEVVELKLSADGRTMMTETERKRAEEAEDRYRVELLRRGLH